MSIQMSRRSAVALGLGLLASAPAVAIAQTITKTGTSETGEALEGLVTVHGRSYLYVGGELYKGGRREYRGKERYFWPDDGHMAVAEEADGTYWGPDGGAVTEGEALIDGKWYYLNADGSRYLGWRYLPEGDKWCYYSPDDDGAMVHGEAYLPKGNDDGVERAWYYFDESTGACAHGWRDLTDGRRVHYGEVDGCMSHGWFELDGAKYCADPVTGDVARGKTCVDPCKMTWDEFGSVYDFDADGRASWHVPVFGDLPNDGVHGPGAALPESVWGDERQRSVLWALSRVGCPYVLHSAPEGFVCDGLTGWSVTNGTDGRVTFLAGVDRQYQDMSWQHKYIREKNGTKADWSGLRCGDIVFWGDTSQIENHSTWGSRHVSMYYGVVDGRHMMIHAADPEHGCCLGSMDEEQAAKGDFIDFGSPYDEPVSECEVWG